MKFFFSAVIISVLNVNIISTQTCFEPGKCEEIPDQFITTTTKEDCLAFCQNDVNCQWFTWYNDTVCTTFLSCQDINPNCGTGLTCFSGEKSCRVQPQCDLVGQCAAIPIGNSVEQSAQGCLEHTCLPNPSCEWFTYDSVTTICFIYDSCDFIDTSCATCVSGEKECQIMPRCWFVGQCLAVPILNSVQPDQDACLQECKATFGCEYFTFDTATSVCLLFETCDQVDDSCFTCISGEDECSTSGEQTTTASTPATSSSPPLISFSNVVIMGGYADSSELDSVESYSFDGTNGCSNPPQLPFPVREFVSGYYGDQLLVAGGTDDSRATYSNTYGLSSGGSWEDLQSLQTGRGYAASVVTPQGWWVLGGTNENSGSLSSTEMFQGGSWTSGENLPEARLGMCAVQLDDTRTLIAGGATELDAFSSQTLIFDWNMRSWSGSGNLLAGKIQHDCVRVGSQIITAGGTGTVGGLSDAEAYDISSGTWSSLPNLPHAYQAPAMAVLDGMATLIGGFGSPDGYSEKFFQFDGQSWQKLSSPILDQARFEHRATAVPDEALSGCSK